MGSTINGKQLEFGNPDQIKFLQQSEVNMRDMLSKGISTRDNRIKVQSEISWSLSFKCVQCGEAIVKFGQNDVMSMESADDIIAEIEIECKGCRCIYVADNGILTLDENPRHPERITVLDNEL